MPNTVFSDGITISDVVYGQGSNKSWSNDDDTSTLSTVETAFLRTENPVTILNLDPKNTHVANILKHKYIKSEEFNAELDSVIIEYNAKEHHGSLQGISLDRKFDLIWCGELLCNLSENRTRQLLDFSVHHLTEKGRLIAITNGEFIKNLIRQSVDVIPESTARSLIVQFLSDGYGFREIAAEQQTAVSLIAKIWFDAVLLESPLRVQSYHARGWRGSQDVVVVKLNDSRAMTDLDGSGGIKFDYPGAAIPLPLDRQILEDATSVPGFNEDWYLAAFPEVAAAVSNGGFKSGLEHFISYGWSEGRPPFNPELTFTKRTEVEIRSKEHALDRLTRRELETAALQNLPLLPATLEIKDNTVILAGLCAAPSLITSHMGFFLNSHRITAVEYPIWGPEQKQFTEVPGLGLVFRAKMPLSHPDIENARFWRLDAAPNGFYKEADWKRSFHFMNPKFEKFPFPSETNIKRVIGDTSVERFAMGGATIFQNASHYLSDMGKSWADFTRVLDWGCGAGRLTRYLIGETNLDVTGVDIDSDNVAWCNENLVGGGFETVPLRPPTRFADKTFDLVFGLSVLTHLQERDQFLWLQELRRITQTGALLFLSIQGPTQLCYTKFPPHLYRKVQEEGYLDLSRDPALDDVVSDKEYYRAAMHSRPYVVERWSEYFDILEIVDAIAGVQDFVVLRRK